MENVRSQGVSGVGREGLRDLVGSRGVRVLLGVVALAQGALAAERAEQKSVSARKAASAPAENRVLPPVVVTGLALENPRAEAPARKDEARALAQKYARKGYKVSPELAGEIREAATENGIDLEVAFGLVRAESGFRNSATSPVGAVGLTQLMPATAAWMEPGVTRRELRDTETNLRVGFKYLRYLMQKYDGNERLALLAYNRGPGTVDKALKRGRNPDNGYADFVLGREDHGHTLYSRGRGRKR